MGNRQDYKSQRLKGGKLSMDNGNEIVKYGTIFLKKMIFRCMMVHMNEVKGYQKVKEYPRGKIKELTSDKKGHN